MKVPTLGKSELEKTDEESSKQKGVKMDMENEKGTRATRLSGLERFAGQVFANSQGVYSLDDYDYFDDTSLFSTAAFTVVGNGVNVGQQIDLFEAPVGSANGQGFNRQLTYAETNLQRGQAGGKFPQNQAYAAVAGGFNVYMLPVDEEGNEVQTGGVPIPNDADLLQILQSITWLWNVGGNQSPTLFYEPLVAWPSGFGMFGTGAAGTFQAGSNGGPVSTMRKFSFPLMFPPNTAAQLQVAVRRQISNLVSVPNGTKVCVAMHLRGYMLSKVR